MLKIKPRSGALSSWLLAAALAIVPGLSFALEATLEADAYVKGQVKDTTKNYGHEDKLVVQAPILKADGPEDRDVYIRFNVCSVVEEPCPDWAAYGMTVANATLKLYVKDVKASGTFNVCEAVGA